MNRNEELLTRWIDGELGSAEQAEFDALKTTDPEFAERVKAEALQVGEALRDTLPADLEPPYPDFFYSQIEKRIREEAIAPRHSGGSEGRPSVWSWLKSPFTLAAAAAACAVILFTRPAAEVPGGNTPSVISTYAPDPTVTVVRAEYDAEAEATVIMLTGLARIPDEVEVGGQTVATYIPTGPQGFGRFYTDEAKLAYIMEPGADGAPNIFARGARG